MDRSPPFRVYCQRLSALFRLAFASPPCRKHLSLPLTITPGPIMQKVRRHPTWGLRQLVSNRFQVLLTPLTGVLFTFPSRYYSLSVDEEYLALRRGRRRFTQGFTCPVLLRILLGFFRISVTGVSPSLLAHSRAFSYPSEYHNGVLQPRRDKSPRFGLFPFRSPLLRESHSLSLPPLTEMFHFSGFTLPCLFYSAGSSAVLPALGFPIRKFPDQSVLAAPRDLSQSCHVLLRLSSPRHPPIALTYLILQKVTITAAHPLSRNLQTLIVTHKEKTELSKN